MRLMGVDLDVAQPRSKLRRMILLLMGTAVLSGIVAASFIHYWINPDKTVYGTAQYFWRLLRHYTRLITTILLQLVFYGYSLLRWTPLGRKVVDVADRLNRFQGSYLGRVRRASLFFVVLVFCLVIY